MIRGICQPMQEGVKFVAPLIAALLFRWFASLLILIYRWTGGFDAAKFDDLLGLKAKGLKTVVTFAIGFRDEELDAYANLRKVRIPESEFATFID
ncbi:hypothetical protein AAKU52_000219 [Pedobacter sp. CG_S7]|uniref:hypothetical protein n=1 Tax=Pedobacter sp. CG_S7 TaxID=3143930 RepID=UPI00339681BB